MNILEALRLQHDDTKLASTSIQLDFLEGLSSESPKDCHLVDVFGVSSITTWFPLHETSSKTAIAEQQEELLAF